MATAYANGRLLTEPSLDPPEYDKRATFLEDAEEWQSSINALEEAIESLTDECGELRDCLQNLFAGYEGKARPHSPARVERWSELLGAAWEAGEQARLRDEERWR